MITSLLIGSFIGCLYGYFFVRNLQKIASSRVQHSATTNPFSSYMFGSFIRYAVLFCTGALLIMNITIDGLSFGLALITAFFSTVWIVTGFDYGH